jgi:hypothetical protein
MRGHRMRKILHWLTRDDVARTNAAQACARLQHRRHDRDDTDACLARHAKARIAEPRGAFAVKAHHILTVPSRRK